MNDYKCPWTPRGYDEEDEPIGYPKLHRELGLKKEPGRSADAVVELAEDQSHYYGDDEYEELPDCEDDDDLEALIAALDDPVSELSHGGECEKPLAEAMPSLPAKPRLVNPDPSCASAGDNCEDEDPHPLVWERTENEENDLAKMLEDYEVEDVEMDAASRSSPDLGAPQAGIVATNLTIRSTSKSPELNSDAETGSVGDASAADTTVVQLRLEAKRWIGTKPLFSEDPRLRIPLYWVVSQQVV